MFVMLPIIKYIAKLIYNKDKIEEKTEKYESFLLVINNKLTKLKTNNSTKTDFPKLKHTLKLRKFVIQKELKKEKANLAFLENILKCNRLF